MENEEFVFTLWANDHDHLITCAEERPSRYNVASDVLAWLRHNVRKRVTIYRGSCYVNLTFTSKKDAALFKLFHL